MQHNKIRKDFKLAFFRNLSCVSEMIEYAQKHLTCLGQGSSRIVFAFSKSRVLKIAINEKGLLQNEAEYEVAKNLKTKKSVCAIYEIGQTIEGVVWLISQIVRVIKSADEFRVLSGFGWESYGDVVKEYATQRNQDISKITSSLSTQYSKRASLLKETGDIRNAFYYEKLLEDLNIMSSSEFFHGIISAMQENHLMSGDILEVDHYGKTSDGKIVLLDYGFTEDIANKFYRKKKDKKLEEEPVLLSDSHLENDCSIKTVPMKKLVGAH